MTYDVVVPTTGRPSLNTMLAALADDDGPRPGRVVIVDDRKRPPRQLEVLVPKILMGHVVLLRSGGRGPAAARNLGWRACDAKWIVFLDDDVVPQPGWSTTLAEDIADAGNASASQGRVRVPRGKSRPTDWERSVHGLEEAAWATADIAYRRDALVGVGGFDERFPRPYREDSDLGLRVVEAGGWIVRGRRSVEHPVGAAPWWQSISRQRGNADDALMLLLHGPGWERRAGALRGARRRHVAMSALLVVATTALVTHRAGIATTALVAWLGLTSRFAWERISPGSRTMSEVATMLATSPVIPVVATGWWFWGIARGRRMTRRPRAVLMDRDGTVIDDVPYNANPGAVRLRPGARAALDRLRGARIPVAVITNQSGVARGRLTPNDVARVNRRVEELAGPLAGWFVCVHGPRDGCECRKPKPGLVFEAARALGISARHCAVIGDIEADLIAAERAGARGILVPAPTTRREEIARAPEMARTLDQAIARLLGPA